MDELNVQAENVELDNNPEVSLFVNCNIVWLKGLWRDFKNHRIIVYLYFLSRKIKALD